MENFKNISIKIKQCVIIAMLIAGTLVLFCFAYTLYTRQLQHTVVIYTIERQFISIKLIVSNHGNSKPSQDFYEQAGLFQNSLYALKNGGILEGLGSQIKITAADDEYT